MNKPVVFFTLFVFALSRSLWAPDTSGGEEPETASGNTSFTSKSSGADYRCFRALMYSPLPNLPPSAVLTSQAFAVMMLAPVPEEPSWRKKSTTEPAEK